MSRLELLKANREKILELAEKHGAYDIRVFGSVVRGEDNGESDVDLLIKYRSETSPWFPAGFKLDLEDLLGCSVDVVSEAGLHRLIKDDVLSEAQPL